MTAGRGSPVAPGGRPQEMPSHNPWPPCWGVASGQGQSGPSGNGDVGAEAAPSFSADLSPDWS